MRFTILILVVVWASACKKRGDSFSPAPIAIGDESFVGHAEIVKLTRSKGFKVVLTDEHHHPLDQIVFHHELYQFDTADVNHDGRTEILIGIIKPTYFDPVEKNRLFILRIDEEQLRPLWFGSRVCQELLCFKTIDGGYIETLEKTKRGNYAIGRYAWQGFGLTLVNYVHNEISFDDASAFFSR